MEIVVSEGCLEGCGLFLVHLHIDILSQSFFLPISFGVLSGFLILWALVKMREVLI